MGQGGAMAIEDAVCVACLLPSSTPKNAVQERLKAFENIRYKRAESIRDASRKNGLDENHRPSGLLKRFLCCGWSPANKTPEPYAILNDCYKHDEWKHTNELFVCGG